MKGKFVTPRFTMNGGGVPVWSTADWGWNSMNFLDFIRHGEICLVIQEARQHMKQGDVKVLNVVTPRGVVGWVDQGNIKKIS